MLSARQMKSLIVCGGLIYVGMSILPSVFNTVEYFADEISDRTYIKIATAIENVVTLKGTFVSFKKETSFKHFDVELFYDLAQLRKDKGEKLNRKDIKPVFVKAGKDKVAPSIKIVETLGETAGECAQLMNDFLDLLKKKDNEHREAVRVWDQKKAALQTEWDAGLIVSPGKIEWQGAQKDCTYTNTYCNQTDAWRRKCMCKGWVASAPRDGGWENNPPGSQYKACNTGGGGSGGGIYGEWHHWTRKNYAQCPQGHSDPNYPGYDASVQGCAWGLNDINCKQAYPELYTPEKDKKLAPNHNKTGYGSVHELAVARYGPRPTKEPISVDNFVCQDCRQYQSKTSVTDSTQVDIEQINSCISNIQQAELANKQPAQNAPEQPTTTKLTPEDTLSPQSTRSTQDPNTPTATTTTSGGLSGGAIAGIVAGSVAVVILIIIFIVILARRQ